MFTKAVSSKKPEANLNSRATRSEPIEKLNKTVQTKAISAYSSTLLFNSLSLIHSGNYTCTGTRAVVRFEDQLVSSYFYNIKILF